MFLKKLLKLLIKKGKKGIAVRNLTKALKKIESYIAPSQLGIIFKKLAPMVKIYKKKVAGKVYQLPWYITPNRAAFQAAKWIMLGIEAEKKGRDLDIKIGRQFVKTLKNKGLPLKLKAQFYEIISENRSYMRFIRRKFKKKKKIKGTFKKFKNKFTKRALKNDLREIWIANKKRKNNLKRINGKNNNKKIITKDKKYRR